MASRPSPNSLIHCAVCGEDYSATYKRCPFCGAKNAPSASPNPPRRAPAPPPVYDDEPEPAPSRRAPADPDDTYVFDGQDLFDEDPEEDYRLVRPKGGKRLAEKPSSNPFAEAQINWPRMITFLCTLIIIVAALIIIFTVVYPQIRDGKNPGANATEQPTVPVSTDPVNQPTQPVDPNVTAPVGDITNPPVDPNVTNPPQVGDDEPTGLTLNTYDFTIYPDSAPVTIKPTVAPAGWNGTVTFESSDPSYATVSASGVVTHARPDMVGGVHGIVIKVQAGTLTATCKVFVAGAKTSESAPPAQTDPPVDPTQAPPSGGNVTVGARGTIMNAEGGLRVRSGPGTTYAPIASITNGTTITVLAEAGDGWYQINFPGAGGAATVGYIRGEYISTN